MGDYNYVLCKGSATNPTECSATTNSGAAEGKATRCCLGGGQRGGYVSDYHNLSQKPPCWVFQGGTVNSEAWVYTGAFVLNGGTVTEIAKVGGDGSKGASATYNADYVTGCVIAGTVSGDAHIHASNGTKAYPTVSHYATVEGGTISGNVHLGTSADGQTVTMSGGALNGVGGEIWIKAGDITGGYIKGYVTAVDIDMSSGSIVSTAPVNMYDCEIKDGTIQCSGIPNIYKLTVEKATDSIGNDNPSILGLGPNAQIGAEGDNNGVTVSGIIGEAGQTASVKLSHGVIIEGSVRGGVSLHGTITVKKGVSLSGNITIYTAGDATLEIDEDLASVCGHGVNCDGSNFDASGGGNSLTYAEAQAASASLGNVNFICAPSWTAAMESAMPDKLEGYKVYVAPAGP
jgi:hypothetical protein